MTATSSSAARDDRILLAHGGGGELMRELIRHEILATLGGGCPPGPGGCGAILADSAVLSDLPPGQIAFTTDSYVVKPLFFPGGDIGRLAVSGTVNDLAVVGASARALSLSFILEEGFPLADFRRVLASVGETAREAGAPVVTGDVKVVERGGADGLFINTAGVGVVPEGVQLGAGRVEPGDAVLLSGPIGNHGVAVLSGATGHRLRNDGGKRRGPIGRVGRGSADSRGRWGPLDEGPHPGRPRCEPR